MLTGTYTEHFMTGTACLNFVKNIIHQYMPTEHLTTWELHV